MPIICGIDEVGRGPLAGPVTSAAVVLCPDFPIDVLADSKTLSANARERISSMLLASNSVTSVGWAWPEEIDRINIHHATLLSMQRAFAGITVIVDVVLVDGRFPPHIEAMRARVDAIVGGDAMVPEIMAASIIAKVARDRWMTRYGWIDPRFGFGRHKGYPTKAHREACARHGVSPIHRKSFRITT